MFDEFDEINTAVVSVEIEREIYNQNKQPETNGCGGYGCFSLQTVLMFVIGLILFRLILELFSIYD